MHFASREGDVPDDADMCGVVRRTEYGEHLKASEALRKQF